jgi:hypothetical protein
MAEHASIKIKSGKKAIKAKGPTSFVRSIVDQLQGSGVSVPSADKFKYTPVSEKSGA